jgi:hypothetical protein
MIIEMRTYSLAPGTIGKWLALYETHGLQIHTEILGRLVGYFTSEFGDVNEIIHLWAYESYEDREHRRAKLTANAEWKSFLDMALPLIRSQKIRILKGTAFSPIQ